MPFTRHHVYDHFTGLRDCELLYFSSRVLTLQTFLIYSAIQSTHAYKLLYFNNVLIGPNNLSNPYKYKSDTDKTINNLDF